jgi:hypothetical protein
MHTINMAIDYDFSMAYFDAPMFCANSLAGHDAKGTSNAYPMVRSIIESQLPSAILRTSSSP